MNNPCELHVPLPHTHLCLYLYSPQPELAKWPHIQGVSQQEATTLEVPLTVGTAALYISTADAPLSAVTNSSMGLQDPWMREVKYGLE